MDWRVKDFNNSNYRLNIIGFVSFLDDGSRIHLDATHCQRTRESSKLFKLANVALPEIGIDLQTTHASEKILARTRLHSAIGFCDRT